MKFVFGLGLWMAMSVAMACEGLSSTQMCTLRTDMAGHAELATAITNYDLATIAAFYNADTSPAVEAWKSQVDHDTVTEEVDWAEYVAISRQKQGAFSLLTRERILRTGLENVRTGLQEIFTAAESPNSRAALIAIAKRTMTVCEEVFSTGAGPTYDLVAEGELQQGTVLWALDNCTP